VSFFHVFFFYLLDFYILRKVVKTFKSMFEIAFEGFKSVFNTQKVRLKKKKKTHLVKKIKSTFKGQKA
jgi:hypothetical protein